jgi:hypothetical protein
MVLKNAKNKQSRARDDVKALMEEKKDETENLDSAQTSTILQQKENA